MDAAGGHQTHAVDPLLFFLKVEMCAQGRTHLHQLIQNIGRKGISADLIARKGRLVQQGHRNTGIGQHHRTGTACRAAAHDQHIGLFHSLLSYAHAKAVRPYFISFL